MKLLKSMEKDLNNPQNFIEPPVKYKVGELLTFKNYDGRHCVGEVIKEFTKSEFGMLLRVKYGDNEIRDIYYNEIIK